jgi:DNA (cytosine-5)-methyltransferase 1
MTCGDLFAGIGGMSLGLERAGFTVRWQVETEPYCENVLARHWPAVARRRDVRFAGAATLERVDLIAGGFPCQDISSARTRNRRRGLDGQRSGLWSAMHRLVGELRPRWLLVENSPTWRRWMPEVRADLAGIGYAAVPLVVSAGFVGAPHPRPRGFVVAHADSEGESLRAFDAKMARLRALPGDAWPWPDPDGALDLDDGVPSRVANLRALGNAVVPQVVEVIGRAILAVEAARD